MSPFISRLADTENKLAVTSAGGHTGVREWEVPIIGCKMGSRTSPHHGEESQYSVITVNGK